MIITRRQNFRTSSLEEEDFADWVIIIIQLLHSQPVHDVVWTLKLRRNNVVLTSCVGWVITK